jgi:hypothetical protein
LQAEALEIRCKKIEAGNLEQVERLTPAAIRSGQAIA